MENYNYDNREANNHAEESKGLRNTEYNEIESDDKYDDSLKGTEEIGNSFELNSEEKNQPEREVENPYETEKDKEKNLDEHPQKDQRIERQNPNAEESQN